MNKEKYGEKIIGGVAFAAILLGVYGMLPQAKVNEVYNLSFLEYASSQNKAEIPQSIEAEAYVEKALDQPEPSVTVTVNGPTPPPQKPHFDGWVESKFHSQNKIVLAKYRAGNLDELIKVLNNQRTQQIAVR